MSWTTTTRATDCRIPGSTKTSSRSPSTEKEIDDVVAFLASLTSDDYKKPAAKELARQRALSRTHTAAARHGARLWSETGPAKATCC